MKRITALEERSRLLEQAKQYPVGSEEYLNATKAYSNLSDADSKTEKRIDPNLMINLAVTGAALVLSLAWGELHILNRDPWNFVKSFIGTFQKR